MYNNRDISSDRYNNNLSNYNLENDEYDDDDKVIYEDHDGPITNLKDNNTIITINNNNDDNDNDNILMSRKNMFRNKRDNSNNKGFMAKEFNTTTTSSTTKILSNNKSDNLLAFDLSAYAAQSTSSSKINTLNIRTPPNNNNNNKSINKSNNNYNNNSNLNETEIRSMFVTDFNDHNNDITNDSLLRKIPIQSNSKIFFNMNENIDNYNFININKTSSSNLSQLNNEVDININSSQNKTFNFSKNNNSKEILDDIPSHWGKPNTSQIINKKKTQIINNRKSQIINNNNNNNNNNNKDNDKKKKTTKQVNKSSSLPPTQPINIENLSFKPIWIKTVKSNIQPIITINSNKKDDIFHDDSKFELQDEYCYNNLMLDNDRSSPTSNKRNKLNISPPVSTSKYSNVKTGSFKAKMQKISRNLDIDILRMLNISSEDQSRKDKDPQDPRNKSLFHIDITIMSEYIGDYNPFRVANIYIDNIEYNTKLIEQKRNQKIKNKCNNDISTATITTSNNNNLNIGDDIITDNSTIISNIDNINQSEENNIQHNFEINSNIIAYFKSNSLINYESNLLLKGNKLRIYDPINLNSTCFDNKLNDNSLFINNNNNNNNNEIKPVMLCSYIFELINNKKT